MVRRTIISALMAAGLSGCTMAPFYQRPAMAIADTWPTGAVDQNNAAVKPAAQIVAAEIGWRNFFTHPYLQQLIEIALKNNQDLRVATLNIEKARAEYQIQRADLFPSILLDGKEVAQRTINSLSSAKPQTMIQRQYTAGVGFSSYELDVFGRVRSLKDQALALYYATEEAQRSTSISLVTEVANAYLTLLADQASLQLAKATQTNQDASLRLIQHRFDAGIVSALDLNQAKTTVETARANVALYTSQLARAQNALTLLLGAPIPDNVPLTTDLNQVDMLSDLPAGLPSDILQHRPDIMAAEYQLKAANANIGAARAAFFPQISLTASVGTSSTALSQLFKAGSGVWTFIPQITLPIFTAGRNIANLDSAHIGKDIHIAQYQKTIQLAFREVADALAQRSSLMDQLSAQRTLTDATAKTYHLSELRYHQGVDSYLTLLDAQRTLYAAQQGLINSKCNQLSSLVNLYKALGGGWRESTDKADREASVASPEAAPSDALGWWAQEK